VTSGNHHQLHYHPDPAHTPEGHYVETEHEGPIEEHPLWRRDNVILISVGIDVGSAGTQVLFSRVHLKRQAVDLSSRYLVVERDTLFKSAISLTPYASETLIDARALGEIVDDAYYAARLSPEMVDTGVVILTGEALRRENSQAIARVLSEKCGDLVCASAGHHMEAMLAAHGSGAVQQSHDLRQRLINIDIGGGTTKLSVIENGRVLSTAALHVGGRLLAVDSTGRVERLDPAGAMHAERAGIPLHVGDTVAHGDLERIAESMADDLVAALTATLSDPDRDDLYLTDRIDNLDGVEAAICSGGVAEYIYERETADFGDLGRPLGRAIRERFDDGRLPWRLLGDSQGIRSTALGCSEFTAQLSGNTGYISEPTVLLPRRNLTVLRPPFDFSGDIDPASLADAIRRHLVMFEVEPSAGDIVLAFQWQGMPEYTRVRQFANGIAGGLAERIDNGRPLYVILDSDIAMNLGAILNDELGIGTGVLVVDGLELWDFDSVDLGRLREPSMTVPVTIKSLIFSDVTDGVRRRELVHHPRRDADRERRSPAAGC
jgi:ethanolamine utilization protein EutA